MQYERTPSLANDTTASEITESAPRRSRLGAFLRAKRASLSPERFELPVFRRRRVAGLRREEVARLAGISVAWYTQLESGAAITVSPALIGRLAEIFALNAVERAYVFALAFEELCVVESVVPELELLAHSRIAAPTFNDEIALVLRAHRALKVQVYSALVRGTLPHLAPTLDEARCPIGLWLHDDLSPAYRRGASYERAARIHAAFHREIDRVIDAGCTGATHEVEQLLVTPGRYIAASAALERAFSHWTAHARPA